MKTRLVVQMRDGHINIPADHIDVGDDGNVVFAYDGTELVAIIDISAIVTLHISGRGES